MFSKLQSATAMMGAVMISSLPETDGQIVPPPQYDYTSALSCSKCIQAGYQYVYDSGASDEKQFYNQIATGGDYTGFCCTELDDGRIDCNDEMMWKFWTSTVSQEEVETFNEEFSSYFDEFGLEQSRALVAELYSEQSNKVTTTERKYYFLGLSGRITISHNEAAWTAAIQSDADINDEDSTLLQDLITSIETLSDTAKLGDLFRKRFSKELIDNFDTYDNQGDSAIITLEEVVTNVQDKIDTWTAAMDVSGDDGTNDYTYYVQQIFIALYGDEGIVKYEDTADFDATVQDILDSLQTAVDDIDAGTDSYGQFQLTLDQVEADLQTYIDNAPEEEEEEIESEVEFTAQIPQIANDIIDDLGFTKKNSHQFASLEVAMHSCPQKADICGERMIMNDSGDTTIEIEDITNLDSCHILISTQCGLPEVSFDSSSLSAHWKMDFVEFQDGFVTMATKADPLDEDSKYDWYPHNDIAPHFITDFAGYFGELPNLVEEVEWAVEQVEGVYKNQIPLSRITEHLEDYNDLIEVYNDDVASYLTAKAAYDKEVKANLASYDKNKAEYDERSIFTCMFGCEYQTWSEITLDKPVRPVRPAAYSGYLIDDLKVESGMGAFVSGELDISLSGDNNIKAFGVLGQVSETGQGFAKHYDPTVVDPTYEIVDESTECKMKCLMLSLYPTLHNMDASDVTGSFTMTISNAGFKEFTLTEADIVSQPALPAARLDEDKMWEFRVLADGAAYLSSIAATAATLAAFTLY